MNVQIAENGISKEDIEKEIEDKNNKLRKEIEERENTLLSKC